MRKTTERVAMFVLACAAATVAVSTAAAAGSFTNARLIPPPFSQKIGGSEPAISIGKDSTMVVDSLAWLPYQINVWKGPFGSTPPFFGVFDADLSATGGRTTLGSGDGDIDLGSTGTIHESGLDFIVNPTFSSYQLGVSVTNCPNADYSKCKSQILDTTQADRQWITSDGSRVYLSYHDSASSTYIRTFVSTDDGATWSHGGSPVVGQGDVTGNSTFNNIQGPLVADSHTHNVYDVFIGGEQQTKCCSANYNNVYVSRSTDGGKSYTASLVYHAAPFTALNNIFPALAVDPTNGTLYTAWTDTHGIMLSKSTDEGQSWSMPLIVSTIRTTVMPWIAAYGGKVDVVYYGTTGADANDTSAVWNTYDSQSVGHGWKVLQVSNTPNHYGVVCLNGSGCSNNRQLLDLFEVALDPATKKAAVIYTDDTFDTYYSSSCGCDRKLPQVVLAQEQ